VSHRNHLIAAAMMASLAAAPAAAAGPTVQPATARALLLLPLTLTKVEDLDFGTVVSSPVAGTVTINASTGARTHAGGVTEITSAAGQRGLFAWAATPNQQVNFDIVYPATLDDGAGNSVQIALLYLQSDSVIANSSGVAQVGVGGSILISANQAEGTYTNTFDVTASYQ
jgi:hypothetical protein